jgi:hypothetical protein
MKGSRKFGGVEERWAEDNEDVYDTQGFNWSNSSRFHPQLGFDRSKRDGDSKTVEAVKREVDRLQHELAGESPVHRYCFVFRVLQTTAVNSSVCVQRVDRRCVMHRRVVTGHSVRETRCWPRTRVYMNTPTDCAVRETEQLASWQMLSATVMSYADRRRMLQGRRRNSG